MSAYSTDLHHGVEPNKEILKQLTIGRTDRIRHVSEYTLLLDKNNRAETDIMIVFIFSSIINSLHR